MFRSGTGKCLASVMNGMSSALELNAALESQVGFVEGTILLVRLRSRRVGDTPMRGHRVAGPDGAGLARRIVTDGEDEIERRRAFGGELVPTFRAIAVG